MFVLSEIRISKFAINGEHSIKYSKSKQPESLLIELIAQSYSDTREVIFIDTYDIMMTYYNR